jgi:hypothetical protein
MVYQGVIGDWRGGLEWVIRRGAAALGRRRGGALWRIMRFCMSLFALRQFRLMWTLVAAGFLAECGVVPDARPISPEGGEAQRVRQALARWPRPPADAPLRLRFTAAVRLGNLRMKATGTMVYYGPRDFRVTALAEDGGVLFDGRVNWGGALILEAREGLDREMLEALLTDMSRSFEMPASLDGLRAGASQMALTATPGGAYECTWVFDRANGRLEREEIDLGLLDVLRIRYGALLARGWPEELSLVRLGRRYEASFSFAEGEPGARGSAGDSTLSTKDTKDHEGI